MDYTDKPQDYWQHARREVMPFLPAKFQSIIDIGGSSGSTLSAIRSVHPGVQTICADYDDASVQRAIAQGHSGICCDLNSEIPNACGNCDVVMFLDVLEHLVGPETDSGEIEIRHNRHRQLA